MKLRNKKTGMIDDFIFEVITDRIDLYRRVGHSETKNMWHYNSLAELNEEWKDCEEPKEYWFVCDRQGVYKSYDNDNLISHQRKEIGNYFETEEEAEQAMEKLKAYKRLKDKCNFRFNGIEKDNQGMLKGVKVSYDRKNVTFSEAEKTIKDLMFLFGGEE